MEVVNNTSYEYLKKIVELEEEAFVGDGNVDLWILKALIRYGKVFVIQDTEIITIAEYMQCFDKKEIFLYGICTRKKYRNMGYATTIMQESEKYLKNMSYKSILLTVDPQNNIGIEMYKKLGYEIVGFEKDEYGVGVDRYLMRKNI